MVLTMIVALVAVLWLRALVVVLIDRRFAPHLAGPAPDPGDPPPLVSIILPVRDEVLRLEPCLRSLLGQAWPRLEVIVVDDCSTDGTGDLARRLLGADPRLTVLSGAPLPQGWVGKNHACAQGVARAKGELLLFTDADAVHAPACLPHAVATLLRLGGDVLTVVPHMECVGVAERLLQPAVLGGLLTVDSLVAMNHDRARFTLGNGQYLLFKRSAYERIGGHAAVRDRVVDDLALAKAVRAAHLKLRVAVATEVLRVRMYTSFTEIWWGYAKNNAAMPAVAFGLEGSRLRRAAGVGMMITNVVGILVLGLAPVAGLFCGGLTACLAGLALAAAVTQRGLQNRDLFRIPWAWAVTLPLGHLISAAISAHSAWRTVTGTGSRWKGRVYPLVR
ncbi:MAG: glycosyltransferase [Deltaproteobacteria bacterium]|nr:glycosyltransferase [Deltaproteobacteria bacterium]